MAVTYVVRHILVSPQRSANETLRSHGIIPYSCAAEIVDDIVAALRRRVRCSAKHPKVRSVIAGLRPVRLQSSLFTGPLVRRRIYGPAAHIFRILCQMHLQFVMWNRANIILHFK